MMKLTCLIGALLIDLVFSKFQVSFFQAIFVFVFLNFY